MHFSTKWDVPFHDSACHKMDFVHYDSVYFFHIFRDSWTKLHIAIIEFTSGHICQNPNKKYF